MKAIKAIAIGWCCAALSCTSANREAATALAADAAAQQRAVCGLVEAWAPLHPEFEPALIACREGRSLQIVAATYAGCHVEAN